MCVCVCVCACVSVRACVRAFVCVCECVCHPPSPRLSDNCACLSVSVCQSLYLCPCFCLYPCLSVCLCLCLSRTHSLSFSRTMPLLVLSVSFSLPALWKMTLNSSNRVVINLDPCPGHPVSSGVSFRVSHTHNLQAGPDSRNQHRTLQLFLSERKIALSLRPAKPWT